MDRVESRDFTPAGLRLSLFGPPKSGKTTFCLSAPDPLYIINLDTEVLDYLIALHCKDKEVHKVDIVEKMAGNEMTQGEAASYCREVEKELAQVRKEAKSGTVIIDGGSQWYKAAADMLLPGESGPIPTRYPAVYCLAPETRILTRDLRWVPAGSLGVGDRLLGFDEWPRQGAMRRYATAEVTAFEMRRLPAYRLYLADGTELVATDEHPWLTIWKSQHKQTWWSTQRIRSPHGRQSPAYLARLVSVYQPLQTYDAEFLAAAFDSEGSLAVGYEQSQLAFHQKDNVLLARVGALLQTHGYSYGRYENRNAAVLQLQGGRRKLLRFLQEMRPPRLLDKWVAADVTAWSTAKAEMVAVEAVEPVGITDIAAFSTSTGTYIAEGFGAHNSYLGKLIGQFRGTGVNVLVTYQAKKEYVNDRATGKLEARAPEALGYLMHAELMLYYLEGHKCRVVYNCFDSRLNDAIVDLGQEPYSEVMDLFLLKLRSM